MVCIGTLRASPSAVPLQPLQCCCAASTRLLFTPHVDCGDFVIIINADKAVLTGKKLEQKYYRHHTGYVGHLKEVQYKTLMAENPEKAMQLAVRVCCPRIRSAASPRPVCRSTRVPSTAMPRRSPKHGKSNLVRRIMNNVYA